MSTVPEQPVPPPRRLTMRVTKSPVAIAWVDSSIAMKFAKLQRGEALPAEECGRLERLASLIAE